MANAMNDKVRMDKLVKLHGSSDPKEALLFAWESVDEENLLNLLNYACAGVFIDRGGDVDDIRSVRKGIEIFQAFADSESIENDIRMHARYNLANGHGAVSRHFERLGDSKEKLRACKLERDELQTLVLNRKKVPHDLQTRLLVNFGNTLSQLGRKAEALEYYFQALELEPGHPIALGCSGQVMYHLLGIQPSHNVLLLAESRRLLECALQDLPRLRFEGGLGAEADYRKSIGKVKVGAAHIFKDGFLGLDAYVEKIRASHPDLVLDSTLSNWIKNRLLLTVNPYPELCPLTAKDDLFFAGIRGRVADGLERFTVLAHTLNQIKEEFATSRYLYTLSKSPETISTLSSVTQYANTLDYADFGLSGGLLKTSIRLSTDLLDKVANFLNRYFSLGIPDRSVSFITVWYEGGNLKKRVEHPTLAVHLEMSGWLRGIRDVAETLNLFPAPVKTIRNKATHDFLIIENAVRPQVKVHGKVIDTDVHDLARYLLIVAKGIIVNLVAMVESNEAREEETTPSREIPFPFQYGKGISDQLHGTSDWE